MRLERLTMSPSGLVPSPTTPYSTAFGESSHWLEVLLKKILSEVKYSAGSCQFKIWCENIVSRRYSTGTFQYQV